MDSKRLAAPISASYRLDCPQAAGRERLLMAVYGRFDGSATICLRCSR